jgi:hypothetical protein
MRLWQSQLVKEDVGHLGVVVLSGMDDLALNLAGCLEGTVQRSHLHEIGAGAYYGDYFYHLVVICRLA